MADLKGTDTDLLAASEESKRLLRTSSEESLDVSYEDLDLFHKKHRFQKRLLYCNLAFFIAALSLFGWTFVFDPPSRTNKASQWSAYSPILDEINVERSLRQLDGSVIDTNHMIYRQLPSPEVDWAWNNLTNLHSIWISGSEILRMGKDPSTVAKYPDSFGFGSDAYAAELDIFHKIHCLNYLRREIYFDYYYGDKYPDRNVSALHEAHTGHCLSMLLQHLMCDANTEIVTKHWVEGQDHPYPDFSVNRMCGNFDVLREWQGGRRVPNEMFRPWRKPEDVEETKVSEEFKLVFGYGENDGHGYNHD